MRFNEPVLLNGEIVAYAAGSIHMEKNEAERRPRAPSKAVPKD